MKIITFDGYYTPTEQRKFIEQYKNVRGPKQLQNKEYVCTRAPYRHFFEVNEPDLPVFLKYDIASSLEERYNVRKLIPLFPSEEYRMIRRDGDAPQEISKFIEPDAFKELRESDYAVLFRYSSQEQMLAASKELKTIVYDLGKQRGNWWIGMCFDKGIHNYVTIDNILMEKRSKSEYSKSGEFEADFNYRIMVSYKLINKVMKYPYWKNGRYYPLHINL